VPENTTGKMMGEITIITSDGYISL